MARILIAGCGYIGAAAAARFRDEGWEVEGWTASADSAAELAQQSRFAVHGVDITDAAAVSKAASEFDVVAHSVSSRGGSEEQYRRLYLEGGRNLLQAFPGATLIFTSSTSVYGQADGSVVDETSPADPSHEKGRILRETEKLVVDAGGIVMRLAGIHGPGRSYFLTRFLDGIGIARGNENRFINQVHRDDVVSALGILADRRSECAGEIYNVVADTPITAQRANEWLSDRLKKPIPSASGTVKLRTRGESNKQVANGKLRALGWRPCYPTFEAAMEESILPSFGL
jgi:nucleoside-diphosphate-sugar epimerase